jgi:hypothetical protein
MITTIDAVVDPMIHVAEQEKGEEKEEEEEGGWWGGIMTSK